MSAEAKWSDLWSGDTSRAVHAANHLLPFWVCLALVVVIAWQLASIAWTLVPGSSAGASITIPPSQLAAVAGGSTSADVQAIAGASIFGKADPADETPVEPVLQEGPDLEETDINLTLKGTIASDVESQSAAVISLGSGDDQVFTIGKVVASGARLHAVYSDRVVLNEGGRLTALYLPEEYEASSQVARRPVTRQVPTRVAPERSIQSVVSNNVARLSDVIRPTPYFVDGQQQGYRVYPGRDRRQFAALGLRPGDLIRDIDGQSLTDPGQAMEIFQSLGTADQVSVTVERDGQPETIILSTDQLDLGEETEDLGETE